MRYTVLTFRTFHHRITKYLGVLVGAALIATLGLPSAVQAQTPASAGIGERRWDMRSSRSTAPCEQSGSGWLHRPARQTGS